MKEKEYLIVDKETGEIVGERKISEISGNKKPSNSSKAAIAVIASACLILVICLIWISSVLSRAPSPAQDPPTLSTEPEPTSAPAPTPNPTLSPSPALTPVIIRNGEIVQKPSSERLAPLTVKASEDANCFILLKPLNPPSSSSPSSIVQRLERMEFMVGARMSFYVAAGNSAEVLVPLGEYEIYYATGQTWYGSEEKFGSDTQFYKCDDTFDFYKDLVDGYVGWTLTLYKVSNGNMDTMSIDESDFPVF